MLISEAVPGMNKQTGENVVGWGWPPYHLGGSPVLEEMKTAVLVSQVEPFREQK